MGHGIALTYALAGCRVSLYDGFEPARAAAPRRIWESLSFLAEEGFLREAEARGAADRITLFDTLAEAVRDAELVLESVPENLALKRELFAELDALCPPDCVLASNTSSLPLSGITEGLRKERRAMAMVCHWYNPPFLIPIVELSFFGNMDAEVFERVRELHIRAGKQPVKVLKDIPGLVANRILHAMAREVFHLIEIEAASPEDIDRALKFGPGFRAATTGLLETADMGGLDIWCAAEDNLFPELNNADRACDLLRDYAARGKLGVKSGEGFFPYPGGTATAVVAAFRKRLLTQLRASGTY
jgi:3-hydroxybutyryl-CoA dehydrogenase